MENIILGTLLGDACLDKDGPTPRLRIGHGKDQLDYLKWKGKLIGCEKEPKPYITGYGSLAYSLTYYNAPLLHRLYDITHKENKKSITRDWLDYCDDLSLALWYQDDGSWSKSGSKAQNGDRSNRHAFFFTCGFDDSSMLLLQEWLISRGLKCKITPHKKIYKMIKLTHGSTLKLWNIIAPYLFLKNKVDMGIRAKIRKCEYCSNFVVSSNKICNICLHKIAIRGTGVHKGERLYPTILKRFGTCRKEKLISIKPVYNEPELFWFNHKLLLK